MNELNLTPTENIILIIVCLVILLLLWRYDSYIELDISPQIDEVGEDTTDHVKERYGAYIWFSNKHYN